MSIFNWFKKEPKEVISVRTPIKGIYTFFRPPHIISLEGNRVEVEITEVMEKYYRIRPIQVIIWASQLWEWREETPALAEKRFVEVIKWIEPTPVAEIPKVTESKEVMRRQIKLK